MDVVAKTVLKFIVSGVITIIFFIYYGSQDSLNFQDLLEGLCVFLFVYYTCTLVKFAFNLSGGHFFSALIYFVLGWLAVVAVFSWASNRSEVLGLVVIALVMLIPPIKNIVESVRYCKSGRENISNEDTVHD